MSIFEFVLVMASLIMALGVTLLLRHVAAVIRYRTSIELYWVPLVWMALQFVAVTWVWWSLWDFAAVEWTYPRFFFLLAGPTVQFIAISMLVSTDVSKPNASLSENFSAIRLPFMLVLAVFLVFVSLDGWVFGVEPLWNSLRLLQVAMLILYLIAAVSSKPIVQKTIVIGFVGLFIYGLLFLRYLPGAVVSS
jgi:hypothetical protein